MTDTQSVTSGAFLLRLNISQFSPRKLDKKATREARERAAASDKAGVQVHKRILASDVLEDISSNANAARAEFRRRTVAWQYDGVGAITADGYPDFLTAMGKYRAEHDRLVKDFLASYDAEARVAPQHLGSLYDPADYPAVAEVASKFSFAVTADPMPQSGDFRVQGLGASQAAAIKASIDARFKVAVEAAASEAWDRIVKLVDKMQKSLAEYKPRNGEEKAQKVFHDTLVTNVQDLINVLPSLNINKDPALTEITTRLQRDLCAANADQLKEDEALRKDVGEKARVLLQEVWAKRRAARGETGAPALPGAVVFDKVIGQ